MKQKLYLCVTVNTGARPVCPLKRKRRRIDPGQVAEDRLMAGMSEYEKDCYEFGVSPYGEL